MRFSADPAKYLVLGFWPVTGELVCLGILSEQALFGCFITCFLYRVSILRLVELDAS